MKEPYFRSNLPALPDPERAAAIVSQRVGDDGRLRAECRCDDGEVRAFVMVAGRWVRDEEHEQCT